MRRAQHGGVAGSAARISRGQAARPVVELAQAVDWTALPLEDALVSTLVVVAGDCAQCGATCSVSGAVSAPQCVWLGGLLNEVTELQGLLLFIHKRARV